ncbi:MAG: PAS domain-containing protein, partial [Candidatus Bathyarchaeia archaeon]
MDYTVMWGFLSFLAVILAVSFGYMYHKDNDKRKLIFALSFLVASPNHILMNQGWKNIQSSQGLLWGILPILSAVLIVVISSLWNMKDFDKPFKAFVLVLAASLFLMFIPIPAKTVLPPLMQSLTVVTIAVSVYLYIKKRETSNLMFLLSITCFAIAGIGTGIELEAYFNTFSYTFAYLFIGLVFLTSKGNTYGDVASFFSLKTELENTKKQLKTSQERLTTVEPVFAASTDAIIILDIQGNMVDCNQATLDLLGLPTKTDVIG